MPTLEYTQENSGQWPISASSGQTNFVFFGTFEAQRIKIEASQFFAKKLLKIILVIIAIAGFAGLAIDIKILLENFNPYIFFLHAHQNLLLWLGVLAVIYLWAVSKQERDQKQSLHFIKGQNLVDVYKLFDQDARQAWNNAPGIAKSLGLTEVSAISLFYSLLEDKWVERAFLRINLTKEWIKNELSTSQIHVAEQNGQGQQKNPQDPGELYQIPFIALEEALKLRNDSIDPLMLVCALAATLPEEHQIQKLFYKADLDLQKLEIISAWNFNVRKLKERVATFGKLSKFKSAGEINKGFTSVPTPNLDHFSEDLTFMAKYSKLPVAIGREEDLDKIFGLISEGTRNVIIKGEPGTGRNTVINELAYSMAAEQVPRLIQDKRLVKMEIARLVGSTLPVEQVFINALSEADRSGNIVLVFEDMHLLAKTRGEKGLQLSEVLTNYLQRSNLVVFGTTTPNDYIDYLNNSSLTQIFTTYELLPLKKETIILASCVHASFLEGKNNVFFTYSAIEKAVELSDLYFKDIGQPQKTVRLLEQSAIQNQTGDKIKAILPEDIEKIISEKTHVPVETLSESEAEKVLNLEQELKKYVIGQVPAIKAVAEVVRRARSGLASGSRPIASLLFIGPTGVGKTELAKTLARVYFGREEYFLRLDMSEFQGPDGLQKLLGAGRNEANTAFVNHLKNYPFCLFLLDEFEKASLEVRNLFLQILEDGRLTTSKGETLDLTHTIIIATSNAGTKEISEGLKSGQTLEQIRMMLMQDILTKYYSPELLNRFDSIILFTALNPDEVQQVTRLQLNSLGRQLDQSKNIKFKYSDTAVKFIAENAYDPQFGARPIRRYIQDNVEDLVAKALLQHSYERGAEMTLNLDQNGQLVLT